MVGGAWCVCTYLVILSKHVDGRPQQPVAVCRGATRPADGETVALSFVVSQAHRAVIYRKLKPSRGRRAARQPGCLATSCGGAGLTEPTGRTSNATM